jgi:hypothetical protein
MQGTNFRADEHVNKIITKNTDKEGGAGEGHDVERKSESRGRISNSLFLTITISVTHPNVQLPDLMFPGPCIFIYSNK